jgi:hypothetical protein
LSTCLTSKTDFSLVAREQRAINIIVRALNRLNLLLDSQLWTPARLGLLEDVVHDFDDALDVRTLTVCDRTG